MRNRFYIIALLSVFSLSLAAQTAVEWQSTSAMQSSGSSYSSQVTAVGATSVTSEATTTENYAPAQSRPRRVIEYNDDINGDPGSPLGDGLIPLSLLALAFAGFIFLRRRKTCE